jgi:hypothetical protein
LQIQFDRFRHQFSILRQLLSCLKTFMNGWWRDVVPITTHPHDPFRGYNWFIDHSHNLSHNECSWRYKLANKWFYMHMKVYNQPMDHIYYYMNCWRRWYSYIHSIYVSCTRPAWTITYTGRLTHLLTLIWFLVLSKCKYWFSWRPDLVA